MRYAAAFRTARDAADNGILTTIMRLGRFARSCAGGAIRCLVTRLTGPKFSLRALIISALTAARRVEADWTFICQVIAFAFVIHGIDLVYKPAAFIVGGLVAIAALEFRSRP